ncbi:hypothetical protein BJI67_15445 [Acidihalobacter aeolianus]|uniref:Peptidyl-prolyl cis-trans isomerase n=1 Tax=Acidihalobacter aeolianus TaxID=2792603 RepID=A0A1D8KBD4_9GAMM|nr:peptidylprolyl isomerase [Acidihalobacter aeolianus]AOV18270.1 hypothetical protein BJI67_15445 [Acidihalobacter aeolianus]
MNYEPKSLCPPIGPSSRVRLHYAITLENGTVADATMGEDPLDIEIGTGALHPNLERLLIGRKAGSTDVVVLPPERAFGLHDPSLVQTMPREDFPHAMALEVGALVAFTTPGGDEVPGIVHELTDNAVTVDFNHPFAGHRLTIGLQILAVDGCPPEASEQTSG